MTLQQQQELESTYMVPTFARKPVCLVAGQGMHVQDDEGADYLDFIGGIGVCSLGHCHPKVVDAIQRQAAKLMHVSNYYYIEQRGEVAKLLSDALNCRLPAGASRTAEGPHGSDRLRPLDGRRIPSPDPEHPGFLRARGVSAGGGCNWQSFFANSGAEANECMIKLARLYAKKRGNGGTTIITLDGSFHGRTMETLAATAQPVKQESFQPLPGGFTHIKPNDMGQLNTCFDRLGDDICAFMFEPIQGESGVHPCTPEYLQAAAYLCERAGALMIADEVQTGMYRTGTPYAFQQLGIVPHIVSSAKGIADGFPMGACSAREEIAEAFAPGDHGSTFGGSNLAMAAAHATLHALKDEGIAENAAEVGAYLRSQLSGLSFVTEVRGLGLMVGADLEEGIDAHAIVLAGLDEGLLLNATGPHTLRFLPPLICTKADVDVLMKKLAQLGRSSR
ncbi:aspartate aminotransferase family protein [Curtanaerobium respiraculi]|uniref:aspartate aminotransferase family protein n=1 Tax=Curtanaerobium respiraculi TaxID=2949669 RepID=UPI0024B3833D|nr:aminotransferase class III-fold pyridoxal phosphate-dependent enzyme [Curtanaerobium respiraculi]